MMNRLPGLPAGTRLTNSIPQGSPLEQYRGPPTQPMMQPLMQPAMQPPAPAPIPTINPPLMAPEMPMLSPAAPLVERKSKLPSAPPSKTARPSIWDKEHISETLANIGAGFLSNQNFGEGLGAAAQAMAAGQRQLREEGKMSVSYGGPNDQFEISVDPRTGERTVREVPEFAQAVEDARAAKNAPSPKDSLDFRTRAIHAISQLPASERQRAYANLIASPQAYGIDPTGLPPAWSDQFGQIAGDMGMNVGQSVAADQRSTVIANRAVNDDRRLDQGDVRLTQGQQRVDQGAARVEQGAARVAQGAARVAQGASRLSKARSAPPRARKGYSQPRSRAEYNALPSGSKYIAPDGSPRIKP